MKQTKKTEATPVELKERAVEGWENEGGEIHGTGTEDMPSAKDARLPGGNAPSVEDAAREKPAAQIHP